MEPRREVPFISQHIHPADTKSQELQAAKEILGEVFGSEPQDADEKIQVRIIELTGLYFTDPLISLVLFSLLSFFL